MERMAQLCVDLFDTYFGKFIFGSGQATELRCYTWRTSCSVKIGGFCNLSQLREFPQFLLLFLHCMQAIRCLWISRTHIQTSRGQGHARSRMPGAVFVARFQSFRKLLFSYPEPLYHCFEQNKYQIRNQRLRIDYTWPDTCKLDMYCFIKNKNGILE